MPSSSLFLRSCSTFIIVLCFVLCSVQVTAQTTNYTLSKQYSGSTFFDEWDFYDDPDPTHGFVTYVDRENATKNGLIGFAADGALMSVDTTHTYNNDTPYYGNTGYGRPSVRITSQQSFYHGLLIADINHMPSGCGTWPAFWLLGAGTTWPYQGELDIIEGVNTDQYNVASMHTGYQCSIAGDSRTMTGKLESTNCEYNTQTGENSAGCSIQDTNAQSYGDALNAGGGTTFALEWTSDAVKIWTFPNSNVPADITAGTPKPSSWGLPVQIFNGPNCNLDRVLAPQNIVINTDFCGDYGEGTWQSSGCAANTNYDSCSAYVAKNPTAFVNAFWNIGSIKYYEAAALTSTTSSISTSTSTIATSSSMTTAITTTQAVSASISTTVTSVISTTVLVSTLNGTVTTMTITTLVPSTISVTVTNSINTNTVGPLLTSTTSLYGSQSTTSAAPTSSVIPASNLITGVVHSPSILPPAMGGWNNFNPGANWGAVPTITSSVPPPNNAAQWYNNGVITTLTQTWIEPCPTGWVTLTTWVATTWCGCAQTTVPVVPMTVVTTTCPQGWGFATPVTYTVPNTAAITWQAWPTPQTWQLVPVQPTGSAQEWNPIQKPPPASSTWVSQSTPVAATTVSSWASWSTATTPLVVTVVPVPPLSPSQPSQGWNNLPSTSVSPNWNVAVWKGAASKTTIGAGALGVVFAVIALML